MSPDITALRTSLIDTAKLPSGAAIYYCGELGPLAVYGITSADTRRVLLDPEVTGLEFARPLQAVTSMVVSGLSQVLDLPSRPDKWSEVCVLRDGLSFALQSDGFRPTAISFLGLGREGIRPVLQYSSWSISDRSPVIVADIVATGGTLAYSLRALANECRRTNRSVPHLVVAMIGTREGALRLSREVAELQELIPGRPRVVLVFIEALFSLPTSEQLKEPLFTIWDLLQRDIFSLPEFEKARLGDWRSWVERCTIYDGGDRAFSPIRHWEAYRAYWLRVPEVYPTGEECARIRQGRTDAAMGPSISNWPGVLGPLGEQLSALRQVDWAEYCTGRVLLAERQIKALTTVGLTDVSQ